MTELTDLSETDASNTLITAINIDEGCAPSGMNNAVRNTLGLIRRAFKTTIFRLRDSTDQTKLLAYDLSVLTTATTRTQIVPDENGRQALQPHLAGHINGLTLSNNVADGTNDIDIAAGVATDGGNTHVITLASGITKRLDAAWAVGTGNGGLDTGAIANTTYHVWLIKRVDTGVVDVLFSASATSPTMPANYTLKRRIGSFIRASADIARFLQDGDYFWRVVPVRDVAAQNPGTSAVSRTLSVPTGIKVIAMILAGGANGTNIWYGLLSSFDVLAITPTSQVYNILAVQGDLNANNLHLNSVQVRTDTAAAIRSQLSASGADDYLFIETQGWIDSRGRNA